MGATGILAEFALDLALDSPRLRSCLERPPASWTRWDVPLVVLEP